MAILRKQKRDHYTVIDNAVLNDKSLSLKAKGMLCMMLSFPDGWNFSIKGLAGYTSDGITVVRTAIKELEDSNYLKRNQIRDDDGRMAGTEYVVSETPMFGEPISENPISESDTLLNNKGLNTNKSNTKQYKFVPPTISEVRIYIEENGYHVDAERFVDYYTSNGWKVGKNPMKDWKATVRNWERKNGTDFGAGDRVRNRIRNADGGGPEDLGQPSQGGRIPRA